MAIRLAKQAVIGLVLLCLVLPIYGHAILVSATPAVSQDLRGPDIPVRLQFNSRVDSERSRLTLILPNGEQRTLEIDTQSPPNSLMSHAKGLAQGSYILRWQVLAADGHITRGEVRFRIR